MHVCGELACSGHPEYPLQPQQLVTMLDCEQGQQTLACRGEMHLDFPPVIASDLTLHQSQLLATRNQRDRAMMMGLQALRQFAHGGPLAIRKPAYMQQQLVLEMGNAVLVRRFLAKAQETTQLVAEIGECLEILFAQGGSAHPDEDRTISC